MFRPRSIGSVSNAKPQHQFCNQSETCSCDAFLAEDRRSQLRFANETSPRTQRMRERNSQEFRARRDVAVKTPAARPASTTPATARERNLAVNRDRNVAVNRTRNFDANRERNAAVNRTRNADVNRYRNANEFRGRNNVAINRNRNVAVNRTGTRPIIVEATRESLITGVVTRSAASGMRPSELPQAMARS